MSWTPTSFIITYLQGMVDMKLCHMPPTADLTAANNNNIRMKGKAIMLSVGTTSTLLTMVEE